MCGQHGGPLHWQVTFIMPPATLRPREEQDLSRSHTQKFFFFQIIVFHLNSLWCVFNIYASFIRTDHLLAVCLRFNSIRVTLLDVSFHFPRCLWWIWPWHLSSIRFLSFLPALFMDGCLQLFPPLAISTPILASSPNPSQFLTTQLTHHHICRIIHWWHNHRKQPQ